MKYSTKLSILGMLILGIVLFGCVSLPYPTADNQTLVVGMTALSARGNERFRGLSVNGIHLSGIRVFIENIETHAVTELCSDETGFFCTNKLVPGEYKLKRLSFTKKNNTGSVSMSMRLGVKFTVEKNTINNLGEILWAQDADEDANYYYINNYDKVITNLKELDEDNDWANVPISNVTSNHPSADDDKTSENLNI